MLKISKNFRKAVKGVRLYGTACSPPSCGYHNIDPFYPRCCDVEGSENVQEMLKSVGASSLENLMNLTMPENIILPEGINLGFNGKGEKEALAEFVRDIESKNHATINLMGTGYVDTILPNVILRNVLENPAWYTSYTPYQAEISQGRLEALLNFQTMISSLTGMEVANSSLLDAGTSAGEAMVMSYSIARKKKNKFLVSKNLHPQAIEVIKTRADPLGIEIEVLDEDDFDFSNNDTFGCIVQYNDTNGDVKSYEKVIADAKKHKAHTIFSVDLMSLVTLKTPGELGADIVVGDNQTFGIPMNFGGPHAGFLACQDKFKRNMPGRIIGVSKDAAGRTALRMALQTREQHIRREKASSNICTASALIANISGFYAMYHGPEGLKTIANRINTFTSVLAKNLERGGFEIMNKGLFFNTIKINVGDKLEAITEEAKARNIEFRIFEEEKCVGVTLNETSTVDIVKEVLACFGINDFQCGTLRTICGSELERNTPLLEEDVFNKYHTEHELLRYMYRLETKDLALTTSMITLGSCTMKLNSTTSMLPLTMPGLTQIHPHTAKENIVGYQKMVDDLEEWLSEICGFAKFSLQPNSGAAGEYSGIRCIKAYHDDHGDTERNIVITPISAHGTNPATCSMVGMDVVVVECDAKTGAINMDDWKEKVAKHADNLAGAMITYPSTYGIFDQDIIEMIDVIHEHGGLVYMDGANMNAQVGHTNPGFIGADVCHLNLHKTFSIPHGGGGPGIGPIGVNEKLAPYLPTSKFHPEIGGEKAFGQVADAPWGSAAALSICWMYLRMLGTDGLKDITSMAVLNANYMANRLKDDYKILFTGKNGLVAHEFIIDCSPFKKTAGIQGTDIAKRLMDYGFHAPTLSFPVNNALMVEPTESETKEELDRFCDALLQIREEIREIEEGVYPKDNNVLHNAPHNSVELAGEWDHPYTREKAAFAVERLKYYKYWPQTKRIDDSYGDKHFCANRACFMEELNFD